MPLARSQSASLALLPVSSIDRAEQPRERAPERFQVQCQPGQHPHRLRGDEHGIIRLPRNIGKPLMGVAGIHSNRRPGTGIIGPARIDCHHHPRTRTGKRREIGGDGPPHRQALGRPRRRYSGTRQAAACNPFMNQDCERTEEAMLESHFRVIPVLDVKNGQAVHAVGGIRSHYRPLQSLLHPSCDPLELVRPTATSSACGSSTSPTLMRSRGNNPICRSIANSPGRMCISGSMPVEGRE